MSKNGRNLVQMGQWQALFAHFELAKPFARRRSASALHCDSPFHLPFQPLYRTASTQAAGYSYLSWSRCFAKALAQD